MGKFLFGICLFEQFSCFIEQNIFEQKSLGKCPWANFVCATVTQSTKTMSVGQGRGHLKDAETHRDSKSLSSGIDRGTGLMERNEHF